MKPISPCRNCKFLVMQRIDQVYHWVCLAGSKTDKLGNPLLPGAKIARDFGGAVDVAADGWAGLPEKCVSVAELVK